MGNVFAATDKQTGEIVAIKRMIPAVLEDNRFVQRFLREAKLGTKLKHPNVIRVVDAGTDEEGVPFMVMELLKGQTLEQRMKQGAIPEAEAIRIIRQSLLGLQKAHQETVVHRDIKPANIFLCEDGSVRVMDFGIAKALEDSKLTRTGAIIGTLVYMSPEQTQGKPVDARSDLYSLGLVFFEMLAGKFPFPGKTPAVMLLEKVTKPVPPLPETVSPWLQSVLEKSLTKNPEDRFQSAYEMVMALDARAAVAVKPFEGMTFPAQTPATPPPAATPPASAPKKSAIPSPSAEQAKPAPTQSGAGSKTGVIIAVLVILVVAVVAVMMLNKPAEDTNKGSNTKKTIQKNVIGKTKK
jgi:serine/threonine protein kinase